MLKTLVILDITFQGLLNKQRAQINIEEIDILTEFKITLESDGLVQISTFKKFIFDLNCDYTEEEKENLEDLFAFFTADDEEDKIDILLYFCHIQENHSVNCLYIWGIPENGRLGLKQQQIRVIFL